MSASSGKESCRALRAFRTSPGGWRFPSDRSKVLAQMRLIHKSTSKRNVTQRHIGLQHVPSSQFDATPDYEGVGGVPECASKGARKVRFAALNECAEIRDEYRPCDMTINIVTHLARLPGQQAPPSVGALSRSRRLNLLSQQ
jgi:hypothetical protein